MFDTRWPLWHNFKANFCHCLELNQQPSANISFFNVILWIFCSQNQDWNELFKAITWFNWNNISNGHVILLFPSWGTFSWETQWFSVLLVLTEKKSHSILKNMAVWDSQKNTACSSFLSSCWVLNFKPSHYRSDRVCWGEVTAGAVNKSNTSDSQCVCAPQSNTLWTQ